MKPGFLSRFHGLIVICIALAYLPSRPLPCLSEEQGSASAAHTALFIAGRPVPPQSPISFLQEDRVWKHFAAQLDNQWQILENKRLATMQKWAASELKPRLPSASTLFYLFSGPDFVSADTLFPDLSAYVLCGLEPIGNMPDIRSLSSAALAANLQNLLRSLKSIFHLIFFRTLDMEADLHNGEISGVLPILYIFLVRTGHEVLSADRVFLDGDGTVRVVAAHQPAPPKSVEGLHIRFEGHNIKSQELFYFRTNVADGALKKNESILKFLLSRGRGLSYLKAASYLLHKGYFSKIREFILTQSAAVLEDDSGIPFRFFNDSAWDVTLFGKYLGVLDLFKEHYQAGLRKAYEERPDIKPLPFVTGYTFSRRSNLLLAVAKTPSPEIR